MCTGCWLSTVRWRAQHLDLGVIGGGQHVGVKVQAGGLGVQGHFDNYRPSDKAKLLQGKKGI
jgi:hypothetical protein